MATTPTKHTAPPVPAQNGEPVRLGRSDAEIERSQRREGRKANGTDRPQGMVPGRDRRRTALERGTMRIVATGGIIGVGVVLGAILSGQDVAGWIAGLVVALVSVALAALLWSSRQL